MSRSARLLRAAWLSTDPTVVESLQFAADAEAAQVSFDSHVIETRRTQGASQLIKGRALSGNSESVFDYTAHLQRFIGAA